VDLFFFFFEFQIWNDAVFGFSSQELAKDPEFQKRMGGTSQRSSKILAWIIKP